jgi:hypothetical protein
LFFFKLPELPRIPVSSNDVRNFALYPAVIHNLLPEPHEISDFQAILSKEGHQNIEVEHDVELKAVKWISCSLESPSGNCSIVGTTACLQAISTSGAQKYLVPEERSCQPIGKVNM